MMRPIDGGMVLIGRRSDLMSYRVRECTWKITAHSVPIHEKKYIHPYWMG